MHAYTVFCPVLLIWSCHIKKSWSNMTEHQMGEKATTEYDYTTGTVDYDIYEQSCNKTNNRTFRAWFLPTIYTIICLLALMGNFLVILTYLYFKRLKTMTDVYLFNLAMADLLFAISLPFWAASFMSTWHLGLYPCKAMFTIYKVSFFSGMFLLTCISIDRYFSITKAVSAHRCRSSAVYYGQVSSLVTWVIAIVFSVPDMVFAVINSRGTCSANVNYQDYYVKMVISQMVLGFIIPAVVMGFCYICIIKTLMQAKNFERNKAFKVIIAVVVVFVFSQLPYNVVMGVSVQQTTDCAKDNTRLFALDVTMAVAFLRCCVNPFLYAFIGVKFRNDLLKLLKDLGCLRTSHLMYTHCGRRRSSVGLDTETTTTFSP
ncbi:C-C chemokine receptor type 7 precursor [Danio rerio]|uniref:C-C chemokine receptor type 7 precursor n=1 Tax=Danio rerio TaxID=7955 RepID=A5PLI3_DANRE|nr:C-C chemokine receptor type 7 precursor [Danio rerio]AAI42914.1 Zgc:165629 protein [Danio rerio]|eukprot:NP_001092213.1 C-C chemokine receptor type 7 precursor [Danio rerio]